MHLKKLERYLRVNLLGPGHRLIKKNLPGRGLTNVDKHWARLACKKKNPVFAREITPVLFSVVNKEREEGTILGPSGPARGRSPITLHTFLSSSAVSCFVG